MLVTSVMEKTTGGCRVLRLGRPMALGDIGALSRECKRSFSQAVCATMLCRRHKGWCHCTELTVTMSLALCSTKTLEKREREGLCGGCSWDSALWEKFGMLGRQQRGAVCAAAERTFCLTACMTLLSRLVLGARLLCSPDLDSVELRGMGWRALAAGGD